MNDDITFFKTEYKRHSNFAIEGIENTFGQADFGKKVSVTIARNGDFISNLYLNVDLPPIEHNPLSLFEICALAVTTDDLQLLPECIREDCEEIRFKNQEWNGPAWTRNLGHKMIKQVNFDIPEWPEWL